jgi:hypothetical protein
MVVLYIGVSSLTPLYINSSYLVETICSMDGGSIGVSSLTPLYINSSYLVETK